MDTWILSLAVSRANRIQPQGSGVGLLMNAIFGQTPLESFAKWDPASSCWRTFQGSLLTGMAEPWSESWPISGMTVSGTSYRLRPLVPRTSVGGGGVWPTPVQYDATPGGPNNHYKGLGNKAKTGNWHIPSPTVSDMFTGNLASSQQKPGSMHSVTLPQWAARFPTPTNSMMTMADLEQARFASDDPRRPEYQEAVMMWPTPRAGKTSDETEESWLARQADGKVSTPPLTLAVKMWGTPKATPSGPDYARQQREGSGGDDLATQVGGQLNPDWVCWLMGLPIGWVSLEPLESAEILGWDVEPDIPRVAEGISDRVNKLKALGNGIVPAALAKFLREVGR